jgi:hypothetical protein
VVFPDHWPPPIHRALRRVLNGSHDMTSSVGASPYKIKSCSRPPGLIVWG